MIFLYKKNIQTRYSFDCLMARIQKSWESCSGSRPLLASRECHKVSSESIMLLITKAQIFTKRGNLIAKKRILQSRIFMRMFRCLVFITSSIDKLQECRLELSGT